MYRAVPRTLTGGVGWSIHILSWARLISFERDMPNSSRAQLNTWNTPPPTINVIGRDLNTLFLHTSFDHTFPLLGLTSCSAGSLPFLPFFGGFIFLMRTSWTDQSRSQSQRSFLYLKYNVITYTYLCTHIRTYAKNKLNRQEDAADDLLFASHEIKERAAICLLIGFTSASSSHAAQAVRFLPCAVKNIKHAWKARKGCMRRKTQWILPACSEVLAELTDTNNSLLSSWLSWATAVIAWYL